MVKTSNKMNISGMIILGLGIVFLILYVISLKTVQVGPIQMTQAPIQVPSEIQVVVAEDYTDALKNVYAPPVRYREIEYRQLGYLTAPGRDRLPLFGRMLNRRDKWTYYTLEQGIKLPIEYNNRLCTPSPGCDEFSSGDLVKVEGVSYKVNLYETFLISY
jgi:Na+-transporting methylmalonyl-CoA/oxaloacetate decarboxylase gamma subunit